MNVRDMLNKLTDDYKKSLTGIVDGEATDKQWQETLSILNSIRFYTNRLMITGNDEIEGT